MEWPAWESARTSGATARNAESGPGMRLGGAFRGVFLDLPGAAGYKPISPTST